MTQIMMNCYQHGLFFALSILLLSTGVFGVSTITAVSFVPGTNQWSVGNDGIVQVTVSDNTTGTVTIGVVCNTDVLPVVASVFCYELGFENKGVIQISSLTNLVTTAVVIENVRCAGVNPNVPSSYVFSRCSFSTSVPTCTKTNALSVQCGNRRSLPSVPTNSPDTATLAPVNCTSGSSIVRLVNGTTPTSGRVEIFYNGTWGTVCNTRFYQNAAKVLCNMACMNSVYARAISGNFPPSSSKVWLSDLICPENATSTNDCTHSGWGTPSPFCTNSTDAWVECSPTTVVTPPAPNPNVTCDNAVATVMFNKTNNQDLTADMIKLLNSTTYDSTRCAFTVLVNSTDILVTFKFTECGGTTAFNATATSYRNNILRIYTPIGGIISSTNYTIPIICVVPKTNKGDGGNVAPETVTVPPKSGVDKLSLKLELFSDAALTTPIPAGASIVLNSLIYVRVEETAKLQNNQMAIRNCWATPSESRTSTPRRDLIINACPQTPAGVNQIQSINAMTQVFSFTAFVFSGSSKLYVHCETITCFVTDPNPQCRRTCTASKRRKRSIDQFDWNSFFAAMSRKMRSIDKGPFYVTGGLVGHANYVMPSLTLMVLSLALRMF